MKPFDLEAAKRGAAVCNKEGWKMRIIFFDSKSVYDEYYQPIVVEIESDNGDVKFETFCEDGSFMGSEESGFDLMMRDDDYLARLERGYYAREAGSSSEIPNNCPKPVDWEEWRKVYAGQAMQGILASLSESETIDYKQLAKESAMLADAMIEELKRSKK